MDGDPASRNFDTLPIISALNLVLQQHAGRTGVRVGKNRYFFPLAFAVQVFCEDNTSPQILK